MSFNTFDFKFCPQCGERLSYTSSEGYCAYTDCLWNTNDFSPAPAQQSQSDSVAAPAEVGQGQGTPTLPVEPPESDTLWQFLTKGYSLNGIRRALVCGDPHAEAEARMLIERARKSWAQIRSEVGE